MNHPIPDAALDDRHAFVGTSGSGKTYNAGTAVERLQEQHHRTGIVDPLGGWWGLRLLADGKTPSPYKVVIFGGPHGDLPLTEHAGPLIGETCASMAESFILDLSELGTKAAERRFMLGFLTALYRKTAGEPLHLVIDEADMFAPQFISDKDGEAAKLLGMMETIVRRGRIKGFIPWLITQRPAVLNKNVLSQADGLIAMKLTSSQDRVALGDWIEGQADRAEGKRILGEMPTLQLGQGVVWIPGRGILQTAKFPRKRTFDSSRTPKRGETKRTLTLKPIDLGALKDRLAKVEAEVAATDPKKLQAKVAELQRQLKSAPISPEVMAKAREEGHREGYAEGHAAGHREGYQKGYPAGSTDGMGRAIEALTLLKKEAPETPEVRPPAIKPPARVAAPAPKARATAPPRPAATNGNLPGPQLRIIASLAFWEALGFDEPTNEQVASVAGYSSNSTGYTNPRGALKAAGLALYPRPNLVSLTEEGRQLAPPPPTGRVRDLLAPVLTGPESRILDACPPDGSPISNDDLAEAAGYSSSSTGYTNPRGALKTLGLVTYPTPGFVALETWVLSELEPA